MTRTSRAVRRARLATAALSATLLLGLVAVAPAEAKDPAGPPAGLKAISALESQRSSLQVAADGSTTGSLGPSDGMGAPADKTLMPADKVLVTKNTTTDAGNDTTRQAVGLNSAMTGLDANGAPADTPETVRATIDHQYPSESGHITNGTTESVLDFRESVVGATDALFQLSTTNSTAETWAAEALVSPPALGGTYVIQTTSGARVENWGATSSAALKTPVLMDATAPTSDMTTTSDQQWAVIDDGSSEDGQFQLVNRSDGLCLTADGLSAGDAVVTDVCDGNNLNQLWKFNIDDDNSTQISVADNDVQLQDGQLVIGDAESFEFHAIPEPGGAAPTWSVPRNGGFSAGRIAAPYDLAVGDLDQVGDEQGQYHDEAFVAYTDSDDNWAIRVVDYNANASRLLVTGPDASLRFGKNGGTIDGTWYPGNLITEIGDFDGNGTNEVAVAFQGGDGNFYLSFFGYQPTADGGRELKLLNSCIGCVGPLLTSAPNIGLQVGYVDSDAGDFDGDGRDDLAIGFANVTAQPYDRSKMVPNLDVVTFKADLSVRSEEVTTPPLTNGILPPPLQDDPARTQSGIQVEAGLFRNDPENGFGGRRDQIAIGWVATDSGDAPDGYSGYQLTAQFQLYGVSDATDSCGDDGPGCQTSTTPLGVQATPTYLFPHHTRSHALAPAGHTYDVPTLTLEAGRYGGIGSADPPVSGLMASFYQTNYSEAFISYPQVATSVVVPWVAGDKTGQQWTITDSVDPAPECALPCDEPISHRFTAYDRLGQSVVLGAPVKLTVEDQVKQDLLAAEPPAHVDFLGGSFTNVSANGNFYLSTQQADETAWTNTTTNENTHAYNLSESVKVTDTLSADWGPFGDETSASVKVASTQAWSGLDTTSAAEDATRTMTVNTETRSDDAVSISLHDYQVWRYPVIGGPGSVDGPACGSETSCATYYEVTIPGDTQRLENVDGTSNELFSPAWQNNNALSYPVLQDNQVPLADLGPYTSTAADGKQTSVSKALVNQPLTVANNAKSWELDLNSADSSATSRSSTFGWSTSVDVAVQAKLRVGVPVIGENSLDVTVKAGFNAAGTTMNATTGSTSSSTAQKYSLNVPAVRANEGYRMGTAYYYDTAGTPKIVHGVDLVSDAAASFWKANYTAASDPALNLPNTMIFTPDPNNTTNTLTYWNEGSTRQELRGFQTLQVDSTGGVPTAGVPFATNPAPGQRMQFQTQVRNLSLADMPGTVKAHFYAVPVDVNNNLVTGPQIDLGESVDPVPALEAQGTGLVASKPWTAPAVGTASQQYRIFVQLNADAAIDELHPLNGDSCPTSSFDPAYKPPAGFGDRLLDLTSTDPKAADPLGCGQNNQGYGTVTVMPPPTSTDEVTAVGAPAKRANVRLAGAGLLTENPGELHLDENSPVPTVHAGQQVTGLVHATSDANSSDVQTVVVYDGEPEDGQVVYVGQMRGSSAEAGGHAKFRWTPRTPGLHELHHVILGTDAAGEDDEQILRVWVENAPVVQPFTVTARADATTVDAGRPVRIRGTVAPVPSTPTDRGVELQVKTDVGWTDVAETDTAADGSYAFTLPKAKEGKHQYRVKKYPTATSSTGFSPTVSVKVVRQFTVTAAARPSRVDTGSTVAVTGRVTPGVAAGDRAVQLQVKKGSTWRRVATGKTTADGSYRFRVKQPKAGTVTYRVLKPKVGDRRTAASPAVKVTVLKRFAVAAKASRSRMPLGTSARITGRVTPAADRAVQLQRRSGSGWTKVAATRTTTSGAFSFKVKPSKAGTFRYRVKKTATDGRRAVYSPTVKVTVTRRAR